MLNGPIIKPVAEVDDLRVYFHTPAGVVQAVDGVSFNIGVGENLGLVGETGCGKSVTARSFLRLVQSPPGFYAGGSIRFLSRAAREADRVPVDLLKISDGEMRRLRGDRIAMIFQDPGRALNPTLTIGRQVGEVFYQHRIEALLGEEIEPAATLIRRAAAQREGLAERLLARLPPLRGKVRKIRRAVDDLVADALAETQIANPRKVMASYPHELSGGMKQRVMIAQALACNPDLLIADEPTTALDVTIQAKILELISDLQRRHNTSVLYISHDLSLVRSICDRVVVMYAGRIAETGTPAGIFDMPLHPYTRGLIGAIPSPNDRRGGLAAITGNVPELLEPAPSCRFHTRCSYAAGACTHIDPKAREIAEGHEVACLAYESRLARLGKDDYPSVLPERRLQ